MAATFSKRNFVAPPEMNLTAMSAPNSKITVCFFLLASFVGFAQDTGSAFFHLIGNEQLSEAYALMTEQKSGDLTENAFVTTWQNIGMSLGKLVKYEKNCHEETGTGLVSYYDVTFEKSSIIFGVPTHNDKVQGFFVVQAAPCDSSYKAPTYVTSGSYSENHITISDNFKVTVTSPEASNASGVICILLSGSGQQDKDGTIGLNKTLKDLALGLASKGITTVRFPKKVLQGNYTIEDEYARDVTNVLNYLDESDKYTDYQIYLIGHSLGGMVAPTIASKHKLIKGVVMIGSNFRPMEELLMDQTKYVLSLDKRTPEDAKIQYMKNLESQITYLKDSLSTDAEQHRLPFNVPASYWLSLSKYNLNNPKVRRDIKKPLLVLWGEKDYQVPQEDFDMFRNNFKHKRNKFISYPGLNHIFTKSDGTMGPSEYTVQNNIPEYVVADIAEWIKSIKK